MPLEPENGRDGGDAEEGHEPGGGREEIRTGDDGDAAEERDHFLLFPAVDGKSRTDGAPDNRGNHGVGTANQIFGQILRRHEGL